MALRAFHTNPSIGGFGSESSGNGSDLFKRFYLGGEKDKNDGNDDVLGGEQSNRPKLNANLSNDTDGCCDAFAQIIKELVDNAVDACSVTSSNHLNLGKDAVFDKGRIDTQLPSKRVRVSIEALSKQKLSTEHSNGENESNITPQCKQEKEILRVTVMDNGIGMECIEKCVSCFSSSKSNKDKLNKQEDISPKSKTKDTKTNIKMEQNEKNDLTAGRYGIGLTLCLLHAQRLVPNSCASITSATVTSKNWTRASFVVDTEGDSVACVKTEILPKQGIDESGTAVSLLVPGGFPTKMAWPRLAEYFARFQLSLGLQCSLQVMAPTLSPIPLFIRPLKEIESRASQLSQNLKTKADDDQKAESLAKSSETPKPEDKSDEKKLDDHTFYWMDRIYDSFDENEYSILSETKVKNEATDQEEDVDNTSNNGKSKGQQNIQDKFQSESNSKKIEKHEAEHRKRLQRAASVYLNKPIELKNIAHSIQPIRRKGDSRKIKSAGPMLEVDLIVHGPDDEKLTYDNDEFTHHLKRESENVDNIESLSDERNGKIMVIRMVNRVPVLDGAEASACGLVNGVCSKGSLWNSFGLEVTKKSSFTNRSLHDNICSKSNITTEFLQTELHIPTFSLTDSVQVAPFFQRSTHELFHPRGNNHRTEGVVGSKEYDDSESNKDGNEGFPLPAGIRIGNILMILQLHAKPSELPLPTLSKGRLPMNNQAIDDALEVGLASCLRSLQKTNLKLLLTTRQLKRTERDLRYVPAVAAALASLITNSSDNSVQSNAKNKINKWANDRSHILALNSPNPHSKQEDNVNNLDNIEKRCVRAEFIGSMIENRLRLVVSKLDTPKPMLERKKKDSKPFTNELQIKLEDDGSHSDSSDIDRYLNNCSDYAPKIISDGYEKAENEEGNISPKSQRELADFSSHNDSGVSLSENNDIDRYLNESNGEKHKLHINGSMKKIQEKETSKFFTDLFIGDEAAINNTNDNLSLTENNDIDQYLYSGEEYKEIKMSNETELNRTTKRRKKTVDRNLTKAMDNKKYSKSKISNANSKRLATEKQVTENEKVAQCRNHVDTQLSRLQKENDDDSTNSEDTSDSVENNVFNHCRNESSGVTSCKSVDSDESTVMMIVEPLIKCESLVDERRDQTDEQAIESRNSISQIVGNKNYSSLSSHDCRYHSDKSDKDTKTLIQNRSMSGMKPFHNIPFVPGKRSLLEADFQSNSLDTENPKEKLVEDCNHDSNNEIENGVSEENEWW